MKKHKFESDNGDAFATVYVREDEAYHAIAMTDAEYPNLVAVHYFKYPHDAMEAAANFCDIEIYAPQYDYFPSEVPF